jgi:hypothetical protein
LMSTEGTSTSFLRLFVRIVTLWQPGRCPVVLIKDAAYQIDGGITMLMFAALAPAIGPPKAKPVVGCAHIGRRDSV